MAIFAAQSLKKMFSDHEESDWDFAPLDHANPQAILPDMPVEAGSRSPVAEAAIVWLDDFVQSLMADARGSHGGVDPVHAADFARPGSGGGGTGGTGGTTGTLYTQYPSGSADGSAGYDILILFKGTWTAPLQAAFTKAADFLTSLIDKDIGGGATLKGQYVDDLCITAELKAIDGVGNILGQAGPTAVWSATELTATGQMQFDSADAQSFANLGLWDDIVFHEMMHTLGFGSLWNYGVNPLAVETGKYTGAAGLAAYQAVNPTATYIPVETAGGSGTAGSHWSEATFTNEIMTGWIDSSNVLSSFSIASLADLGYHLGSTPATSPI